MTDTAASQRSAISDDFARDWVPRFLAAWHSHDPEQLAGLATDDVRWEDPFIYPNGVANGKDELRRWLRSIFRAFPDVDFEMCGEPMISLDRTRLTFEWRGTGLMTGPLDPPGFAPTGTATTFRGADIHSFRDGLITEVITFTDVSTVAGQIGAMPPPGSIGEKLGVGLQRFTAKRIGRKAR